MPITISGDGTISGMTQFSASAQPNCLLALISSSNDADELSKDTHGDNIKFVYTLTNVGCTVSANKDRITVPSAGTYLVSVAISGQCTGASDPGAGFKALLRKNGSTLTHSRIYPEINLGEATGREFSLTYTLPIVLAANDYLELQIQLSSPLTNQTGQMEDGYFSVTKLN